jgi:uncharacterized protein YjdB
MYAGNEYTITAELTHSNGGFDKTVGVVASNDIGDMDEMKGATMIAYNALGVANPSSSRISTGPVDGFKKVWNKEVASGDEVNVISVVRRESVENSVAIDEASAAQNTPVTGISITTQPQDIASVSGSGSMAAAVSPATATEQGVKYVSSNTAIATISSTGAIQAVAKGKVKFYAISKDGGFSAESNEIQVGDADVAVSGISFTTEPGSTLAVGATTPSVAEVSPSGATDSAVKYESTDTAVATVGTDGVVTGVAAGTCKIVASSHDGGFIAISTEVTVS